LLVREDNMFTQSAYKDPAIMVNQLKDYLKSIAKNHKWNPIFLEDVLELVDESYRDQYSLFKYNSTIVTDMLVQFQNEFEEYAYNFTNGNVEAIPKFTKVYNVLSELAGTPFFIAQTESVSNIATEQLEETAKQIQQTSDDTFRKALPFVFGGLVLYFVAPQIIEAIGEQQAKRK